MFHEDGTVSISSTYVDNDLHGEQRQWFPAHASYLVNVPTFAANSMANTSSGTMGVRLRAEATTSTARE
jgi:hypothetical protein